MPSGLNATLYTGSVWPVSGVADRLAGGRVPHPHRVVGAAGDDARAVGAERHAGHRVGVAGQRWPIGLAGGRVPQPHRVVDRCRRRCGVPSGLNATLLTGSVWPVSGAPIGWPVAASHTRTVLSCAAGDDARAVGAERHALHRAGVAGQRRADGLAGGRVPHPHRVVVAAGDDARAVGAERHARSPRRCGR